MATTAMSSSVSVRKNNKTRPGSSSLYPLSMQEKMSFDGWSRNEPIVTTHTDHWSKLRAKSYKLKKLPTGNLVALCDKKDRNWLEQTDTRVEGSRVRIVSATLTHPQGGTLAPVGSSVLHQYLKERLNNPITRQAPSDSRGYGGKGRVPSACSQRAKLGYKYWVEEKKPLINKTSRSLGSKGTYLGIGLPRL